MDSLSAKEELEQVLRKVQQAKDFTEPWHTNVRRWRDLYNFKHYKGKAKTGEHRYVDPTHTNTVDLAVGILQSNDMRWQVTGFTPSAKEEAESSLAERTLAAILDMNSEREQINMEFEIHKHFIRDGGACLYSYWDKEVNDECFESLEVMEEDGTPVVSRLYYELPLRTEVVDPLNIHLLPGGHKRWLGIAHIEDVSVYDVEQLYDVKLEHYKNLSPSDRISQKNELISWWEYAYELEPDADYNEDMEVSEKVAHLKRKPVVRSCVLYGSEFVPGKEPKVMSGYRSLPYRVNFYNPGQVDDSNTWHSILSPQEHSIKELEDAVNMRKRLLAMYSNMPLIFVTADGRAVQLDPALGEAISLQQGETAGFPKWEGTPPDFERQIELLRSRIQQSGFSDTMYGSGNSSVSGYTVSQLNDQNRIRLEPAIDHLADLWTWVAKDWLDLIEAFGSEYYYEMYGKLRGSDFSERVYGGDLAQYHVRCVIKPEFPNERVRNHALATQAKGTLSERRLMEEYYNVQQPDLERKQRLREQAQEHPLVQQYALIQMFQELADAGDEAAKMALETIKQQMSSQPSPAADQGGRPVGQNNPEQPLGVQSSTGSPTPSNQVPPGQEGIAQAQKAATAAPQMTGEVV